MIKGFQHWLSESVDGDPVAWKKFSKQGYSLSPGTRPLDPSTLVYDRELSAIGQTVSSAELLLRANLKRQAVTMGQDTGFIATRPVGDQVEARYFAYS